MDQSFGLHGVKIDAEGADADVVIGMPLERYKRRLC